MNRQNQEDLEAAQLTTVLNRLRPTVVVRRRVYEVARDQAAVASPLAAAGFVDEDDDESGPPSSVNVARALAALRSDELHRLEQILSAQDEEERITPSRSAAPVQPSVPTLRVGPVIALSELARRLAVSTQELVTALVTRGFFDVTVKSTLPRDTARAAAWMFDWIVEDDDNDIGAPVVALAKRTASKTRAAAPKAKAKAARPAAKAKPAATKALAKVVAPKKKKTAR